MLIILITRENYFICQKDQIFTLILNILYFYYMVLQNRKEYQIQKIYNPHGFSNSPTPYQFITILIILLANIQFFYLLFTQYRQLEAILLTILNCIITIIMIYFWWKTTSTDTTDSIQLSHKQAIQKQIDFNSDQVFAFYCKQCQTFVGQYAFHCFSCNRCTQYFDHHCKWLNNCIGKKNYVSFFILVVTALTFMLFHFVINLIVLIDLDEFNINKILITTTVLIIHAFPILGLIFLMILHIYLALSKKSTIGLILKQRLRQKQLNQNKVLPQTNQTESRLKSTDTSKLSHLRVNDKKMIVQLRNTNRKLEPLRLN